MSEFCFERSFPLVSLFDSYVVISLSYVHFGEDPGATQIGYELRNEGKWVLISHRMAVKPPVILDWS
jgi:hypothetical protein